MFGSNKIKLDKDLLAKVKRYSDIAGSSSPEEFVPHALEKADEYVAGRYQHEYQEERQCRFHCLAQQVTIYNSQHYQSGKKPIFL